MSENPDKGVRSRAVETPPAVQRTERQMFFPLRARIIGVSFKDANAGKRTYVDLYLYGGWPHLRGVPLLHEKIGPHDGDDWTPEEGNEVAVSFFGGNINDPVVIGFLPPPDNEIEASRAEAPRHHRKRNGTTETIKKDGTRQVYVAADDSLEVVGDGTVHIHGDATVQVDGKADITVTGDTTLTTPIAKVIAATKAIFDTPLLHCLGNLLVAGGIASDASMEGSTGAIETPGDIKSTGGNVSDSTRSMDADRTIYNGHDHPGDSGGTTGAPNQAQ